jgi:hypothetical protein
LHEYGSYIYSRFLTNMENNMDENELGNKILDGAFEVHRKLGPGLLESTYQACLAYELEFSRRPSACPEITLPYPGRCPGL